MISVGRRAGGAGWSVARGELLAAAQGWEWGSADLAVQLVDLRAPGVLDEVLASCHVLAAEEEARASSLLDPGAARERLAAQVVFRLALADALGVQPRDVRISRGRWGKPLVSGIGASLSHAGGLVAVGLSLGCELGIDVESVLDADAARGIAAMLHPRERAALLPRADQEIGAAVTRTWVRKEAFLKAWGTGLSRDPSVDLVGAGPLPLRPAGAPRSTRILDLAGPPGRPETMLACCLMDRDEWATLA